MSLCFSVICISCSGNGGLLGMNTYTLVDSDQFPMVFLLMYTPPAVDGSSSCCEKMHVELLHVL